MIDIDLEEDPLDRDIEVTLCDHVRKLLCNWEREKTLKNFMDVMKI